MVMASVLEKHISPFLLRFLLSRADSAFSMNLLQSILSKLHFTKPLLKRSPKSVLGQIWSFCERLILAVGLYTCVSEGLRSVFYT